MANYFGKKFKITTFGESHGKAIGVIIDGCPAGLDINKAFIQQELARRKPGQSKITTQRKEDDAFELLSGIFEGKTTGAPIAIQFINKDAKSEDYVHLAKSFRPSHADFTYQQKYGLRDYRGGGRSSARETASWVAAGAIAKQLLHTIGVRINAYVAQVGPVKLNKPYEALDMTQVESNMVRCPDKNIAEKMILFIEKIKAEGDATGGMVSCVMHGVPIGLGEPVFNKFHAALGRAMLSINAVKGFEYGSGFSAIAMQGSKHNDIFYQHEGKVKTKTNYSGGIQGGITNGETIYFNVAFKPVATLMQDQPSIDTTGKKVMIAGKGRHDPCVAPRAMPIVEAMAALVTADFYLLAIKNKI